MQPASASLVTVHNMYKFQTNTYTQFHKMILIIFLQITTTSQLQNINTGEHVYISKVKNYYL